LRQKADRLAQVGRVESRRDLAFRRARAVHLFAHATRVFDEARIQRVSLREVLHIGERHTRIEVVRTGPKDVVPGRRCLRRGQWLEGGIEQRGAEIGKFLFYCVSRRQGSEIAGLRAEGTAGLSLRRGVLQLLERKRRDQSHNEERVTGAG
jgi:hypothetical protein